MISSAFGFPTCEYVCRGQKLTSFRKGEGGLAAGSEFSQTDISYNMKFSKTRTSKNENSTEEIEQIQQFDPSHNTEGRGALNFFLMIIYFKIMLILTMIQNYLVEKSARWNDAVFCPNIKQCIKVCENPFFIKACWKGAYKRKTKNISFSFGVDVCYYFVYFRM